MSYETESQKSGRRHVSYFEADMDECVQDYGVSPCLPAGSDVQIDTFTDADGVLLSSHVSDYGIQWIETTAAGSWYTPEIQSNEILVANNNTEMSYFFDDLATSADQYAEITVSTLKSAGSDTDNYVTLAIRATLDRDQMYYARASFTDGHLGLYKVVAGVHSALIITAQQLKNATDYKIKIEATGDVIKCFIDDVEAISTVNAEITAAGYTGIGGTVDAPSGQETYADNLRLSPGSVVDALACTKTRSTCQFSQAYDTTIKTYRFFESTQDGLDLGLEGLPLLQSAKPSPAKLTPGKGLGIGARLTVKANDTRHHDRGVDPYVSTRTYDPSTQGTFWGKWLARNKYYTNRVVRYFDGFLTESGYDSANFRSREYIITKINRDKKGAVSFSCDDTLQKLNTAVMPPASEVYLTADIDASVTTIPIDTTGEVEFPVYLEDGSIEYIEPFAGTLPFYLENGGADFIPLTIDSELPFYLENLTYDPIKLISAEFPIGSTVTVRNGSELITGTVAASDITGAIRGDYGSTAAAHSLGDTVQKCIVFDDTLPTDALRIALGYAGITEAQIDTTGWDDQADKWLGLSTMTGVISSPEKVKDVVERLCIQGTVYIWWDEFEKLVKLLAVAPQGSVDDLPLLTDELDFLDETPATEQNMREQITQYLVWYDKIDATDSDESKNMNLVFPAYDSGAESTDQWGLSRTDEIFCDFVTTPGHASAIGNRTIGRLRDGEQVLKFEADIKITLDKGDEFIANTDAGQDAFGAQASTRMQVVSMSEKGSGKRYYEAVKSAFQASRYAYIAPNTVSSSYTIATEEERSRYAFISNNLGFMSDGTEGYKII